MKFLNKNKAEQNNIDDQTDEAPDSVLESVASFPDDLGDEAKSALGSSSDVSAESIVTEASESASFTHSEAAPASPTLAQRISGIFRPKKRNDAEQGPVMGIQEDSQLRLNEIISEIGAKPIPLPVIGSFSPRIQYGIGFAVMLGALIGAGGLATTGFLRASNSQEMAASGTQLKMLSQRLLATTQYAVAGSSDAFNKLRGARTEVDEEFNRLEKSAQNFSSIGKMSDENMVRAKGVFTKEITPFVDGLLAMGASIGELPAVSAKLSQNIKKISADLEGLDLYLISINAPHSQIVAVSQLQESVERVRRTGQGLLGGNDAGNQVSDKLLEKRVDDGFAGYKASFNGKLEIDSSGELVLDGKSLKGDFTQVDAFKEKYSGNATVFQLVGDDFVRITTSVRKEDGSRAVGSNLGKTHPAYASLISGGEYVGRAVLFGRPYITKYEAIKDASGKLTGVLYIGFEIKTARSAAEIVTEYNQAYSTMKFTLNSLNEGDVSSGMEKVSSKMSAVMLKDINESAAQLKEVDEFVQKNVKNFLEARANLQSMLISAESALLSTGHFVDKMTLDANSSFQLVYYSSLLVLLALLGLALIGMINNRITRVESWETVYQNKKNEKDIIDFMGDIMPLEMGNLTSTFTQNTVAMEGITGGIRSSVNEAVLSLRDAMSTVKSTTGSVMINVSESVESSRDLQLSNDRQSKEIEGVVDLVVNLATAIKQVTDNTVLAAQMTSSSKSASDAGSLVVGQTNEKMFEIRTNMQDVLKSVKHLGETSHEIGTIVEAIETITDRTQVIAVNASLEAAKAGAAGKGFQVLAGEVNRLAEQSNEALRTITALVQRIQGETAATIRVVEDSTNNVVEGAKLSESAKLELSKISTLSVQLQEVMTTIRAQSESQSSNAGEVRDSMDRLNTLSSQFQATVSQVVTGVLQIDASMGTLQSTVSIFTTDNQSGEVQALVESD